MLIVNTFLTVHIIQEYYEKQISEERENHARQLQETEAKSEEIIVKLEQLAYKAQDEKQRKGSMKWFS